MTRHHYDPSELDRVDPELDGVAAEKIVAYQQVVTRATQEDVGTIHAT